MDAQQDFRVLHHDEGRPCPIDPGQPYAGWMPETSRRFIALCGEDHVTTASWYHCSVKTVSRSAGRSVVAAAAYRLGECLEDHRYAEVHDYTRRRGVESSFTLAPENSPAWANTPERLWNAAEQAEKRVNSTVGREVELALPAFLDPQERQAIVRQFAGELIERYGVAVTAAIHSPGKGDDRNFHAHILFTTREMDANGLGKKTRALDDKKTGSKEVAKLRELAADIINEHLAAANSDIRVDHRSFKMRGIDREATTHLGPAAAEMERRGEPSERGDINRDAVRQNSDTAQRQAELASLDNAIAEETERSTSPPATPDDAMERVSEAAQPFKKAVRSHGMIASPATFGGMTWWQRVALKLRQQAHKLKRHFAQKGLSAGLEIVRKVAEAWEKNREHGGFER